MLSETQQMINACNDEPSLVFNYIKQGRYDVVSEMVDLNLVNVNLEDSVGNDLVTRLLKARQYDLVITLMKKRNWNVNHQNSDGNTFGHILAIDNSPFAVKVCEQLTKKTNYLPNIKNNKGETALDRALNNNYLSTAFKLLNDKRFDSIDINSFKRIWDACITNKYYGKYTKLNNLEVIVESLDKKELVPNVRKIIDDLNDNMELIKQEIINNNISFMNLIVNKNLV